MFNLRLEEVSFERIQAFCEQKVPECETIDYKREIPTNLEKTISAMANTYGGIILIGVEADQKNNVPVDIPGIVFEKGLEEKITGICLRSIYRPVFPEIKPCGFVDENGKEKALLFIRVQESDSTPHAINNNTDVYIRIRSQSEKFERKATIDEIDWLKNRREKAVEFRQQLLNRARHRYHSKTASLNYLQNCFREVYVVPTFPHNILFSYDEFFSVLQKIKNEAQENGFKRAVDSIVELSKTTRESLYIFEMRKGPEGFPYYMYYQEYNMFGLVYRKNSFWEPCFPETKEAFDVKSFLQDLYYVLKFGLLLYKCVGYHGVVTIGVDVKGIFGKTLGWVESYQTGNIIERVKGKNEMDNEYVFEKNLLISEFENEDELNELLLRIYKEFVWTAGVGKHLDSLIQSLNGEINMAKNYYKN